MFSRFEPFTAVNLGKLFSEYFLDEELNKLRDRLGVIEPEENALTEEEPELQEIPAAPEPVEPEPVPAVEMIGAEEEPAEEAAEQIAEEEELIEEEPLLIEEIIPTGGVVYSNLDDEMEKGDDLYGELLDDKVEDFPETAIEEDGISQEPGAGEEEAADTVSTSDEDAIALIESVDNDMTDDYLLEEHFTSDFQHVMETTPEIASEERQADDARESIVNRIQETIETEGLVGKSNVVSEMLSELNGKGNCSSFIADSEGLVIVSRGAEGFDTEYMASYITEISRGIGNSLVDTGFPTPQSIYFDRKTSHIYLYPLGEYSLALFEQVSSGDTEEEASQLPGEMELREIIMKKVLEDLSKLDGVTGNVVASMDGLSIDSHFDGDRDVDLLSSICSQVIADNQKYLTALGEGELKQIIIHTEDELYSLIPLGSEGILISVLETAISKEIWKTQLAGSAMMITSVFQ
jgi:predicted regulator of Ras-like GTPase activity (Roadblock/LC7/MglB family)